MTGPNPQEGGKEQGFLPESPSADAGPSPRSPEAPRSDDVAELLSSIASIQTTREDLNYLYVNILHARGSLARELRREAVVAIKTYRDILDAIRERVSPVESGLDDRASSRDEGGLRDEPENPLLQATGGDNGR